MPLDPQTPVIIGTAVVSNRTNAGAPVREPVDLLAEAATQAAVDAHGGGAGTAVLGAITMARAAMVVTNAYADPAGLVLHALGIRGATSERWMGGGEMCGTMLADTADRIAAGASGVTVLLAGEAWFSKVAADRGRGPVVPRYAAEDDVTPGPTIGSLIDFVDATEEAVGLTDPIMQYPLLENALRATAGRTPEEHRAWLGELWAGLSAVAAENPWAWDREAHGAEEIARPSRANRMVGFPYTKLMVSNEQVDQGAAVLVCSVAEAERLGVPRERWVFPWLTVQGAAPTMTERVDLADSALARVVGRTLWDVSGRTPDDVAHVDLYSCFPSAVQLQANGYRLGLDRPLTVTGGMRFGGGPWNGFPMHSLAKMVRDLRDDPGALGLWSANGGVVTKLAASLLSTEPAATVFRWLRPDEELGGLPRRPRPTHPAVDRLDAPIETYTVMHDRTGSPTVGFVALTPADGTRRWARVEEPASVAALVEADPLGTVAHVGADGTATIG